MRLLYIDIRWKTEEWRFCAGARTMLITFEGVDGSGKSTQIGLLVARLESDGHRVTVVREPGGTAISESVRTILLQKEHEIAPFAELLLFSAARAQLCESVIRPALEEGHVVVCDRFTDSTLAYQGGGRSAAPIDWLRSFNDRVTGGLVPNRTYYLAMDTQLARMRSRARQSAGDREGEDRMEASGAAFFARVASSYEQLVVDEPDRFLRLDAARPVDAIHADIWDDVSMLIQRRNRPITHR